MVSRPPRTVGSSMLSDAHIGIVQSFSQYIVRMTHCKKTYRIRVFELLFKSLHEALEQPVRQLQLTKDQSAEQRLQVARFLPPPFQRRQAGGHVGRDGARIIPGEA